MQEGTERRNCSLEKCQQQRNQSWRNASNSRSVFRWRSIRWIRLCAPCSVRRWCFILPKNWRDSIEQYGYLGSLHSIAAIVMTPCFGKWLDRSGNQFRVGYLVSSIAGITSYLMYFTASLLPTGHNSVAVYYLLWSRLIDGLGDAGRSMSYIRGSRL